MPTYDVTFPDGHVQTFVAPPNLSEDDARIRAIQERSIAEGRTPTSWWKGFGKQLGEDPQTTGALISGGGMAMQAIGAGAAPMTGGASLALIPAGQAVMAAAPLASHVIQNQTQQATGQNPEPLSVPGMARDAAIGVAGAYGPQFAGKAAHLLVEHLPTSGVAGVLAKLSGAAPIGKVADTLGTPVGNVLKGQTVKEVVDGLRAAALEAKTGVSAREVARVSAHIADGMDPQVALRLVAGDKSRVAALTSAWVRARLGRP